MGSMAMLLGWSTAPESCSVLEELLFFPAREAVAG